MSTKKFQGPSATDGPAGIMTYRTDVSEGMQCTYLTDAGSNDSDSDFRDEFDADTRSRTGALQIID